MSKKVTTNNFWNILCFVALALLATTRVFQMAKLSASWVTPFLNICYVVIGIVIIVSAWNAVASASKGWKVAYWIFVAILAVSMILPFFF